MLEKESVAHARARAERGRSRATEIERGVIGERAWAATRRLFYRQEARPTVHYSGWGAEDARAPYRRGQEQAGVVAERPIPRDCGCVRKPWPDASAKAAAVTTAVAFVPTQICEAVPAP